MNRLAPNACNSFCAFTMAAKVGEGLRRPNTSINVEGMTAPRPEATPADPPRGCGPAWERPGARPARDDLCRSTQTAVDRFLQNRWVWEYLPCPWPHKRSFAFVATTTPG